MGMRSPEFGVQRGCWCCRCVGFGPRGPLCHRGGAVGLPPETQGLLGS